MKRFLISSTFTKILSLVLAVFLWSFVVMVMNPQLEITISGVPVFYSDTEALSNNNLVIVNEQQMKVDIRLKGTRNALANVNSQNITALVDMNGYNVVGEHYIPIIIKLPVDGISVVSKHPENVKTIIDKMVTMKKPLVLNVEGSPKQGYITANPHLSQDYVMLHGPDSVLKTIDKAVAKIKVTDQTDDVVEMSDITFVSVNGVAVTNNLIQATPNKVEARCSILYRKTVKVQIPTAGENASGLIVNVSSPIYSEISIVGKAADLNEINVVYTEPVDITNIKEPGEMNLKLILPANVQTETNLDEINVAITVETP